MIKKKVCMLGAFAVGKTSLVARYVESIFSERYQTTVGVKIDKKEVSIDGRDATLLLWDLHGEDEFQRVRMSYLRGTSGYLLVADGTRAATVEKAIDLQRRAEETVGPVPFLFLLNKSDLVEEREVSDAELHELEARGWKCLATSAKTGDGVEDAFERLARAMMAAGEAAGGAEPPAETT